MPRKPKADDQLISSSVNQEEIKPEVQTPPVVEVKPETEKPLSPATAGQLPLTGEQSIKETRSRVEIQKPVVQQPVRPQYQPRPTSAQSFATAGKPAYVDKTEEIVGVLDIGNDNNGMVRPKFTPSAKDAYINAMQIRRLGLRPGDMITGAARAARDGEKYALITRIDKVNGMDVAGASKRPFFNDLVPIFAQKQAKLETDGTIISTRIIDLFSPIGFGQRGMIVSPPKAGKTTLLKEIAAGVAVNYPDVHLMAILVGERPEEVTDMQRFIKGEVVASSFDQKPEEQTKAAEIAIERAKRLVELGKDVFVVFDSITRLARAYNLAIPSSGRTLSGGFDPAALYPSKRFFGAARNIEGGGSLTIIGTALVDTGSKMDELIFEEFKGTGNMELRLDRNLAERRIFPALDVLKSGTRRSELLLTADVMAKLGAVIRIFDSIEKKDDTTIMIIDQMMKTKNNEEFLKKIGKQ